VCNSRRFSATAGSLTELFHLNGCRLYRAVDAAYSKKKFFGHSDRVAFLFELYQQILSPLESKKNIRRKT
jgi:hypothetical protein